MIAGYFASDGSPYIWCRLTIPGLDVVGSVRFLVDTGSDTTILHPDAGSLIGCPFDQLTRPVEFISAGGTHVYHTEPAIIEFYDDDMPQEFELDLYIGKPNPATDGLDSLLGRDILNELEMEYAPRRGRLGLYRDEERW